MPSSTRVSLERAGRSAVPRLWIAVGAGFEWIRVDLSRVARRPLVRTVLRLCMAVLRVSVHLSTDGGTCSASRSVMLPPTPVSRGGEGVLGLGSGCPLLSQTSD